MMRLKATIGCVGNRLMLLAVALCWWTISGEAAHCQQPAGLKFLDAKIDVDFRREPLESAFNIIADQAKFQIEVDGDGLKIAGYTKNMPQSFKAQGISARNALTKIQSSYDQMCFSVDEAKGKVIVTSFEMAKQKSLPVTLIRSMRSTERSTERSTGFSAGEKAGEEQELAPGIKFRWCPPGTFMMGSPAGEIGRQSNEDQVHVELTSGYWLGTTEVTQGQWQRLMGTTPWKGKKYIQEGADYAASYILHGDLENGKIETNTASDFCREFTNHERRAGRLGAGWKYVLPTEAQWEYACRAGTTSSFSFGENDKQQLNDYAWWGGIFLDGNAGAEKNPHRVGLKQTNAWGLQDMHGNVYEYCSDWYAPKLSGGRNPLGAETGWDRVYRGGAWTQDAAYCRSASREAIQVDYGDHSIGFRVAAVTTTKLDE